ncbi:SH3 domain-containing protein 19, partial [Brachionichthys hirsutus]|uniref:SH3 domain-containing protein 19 n=1 Tax=Brachionichthys hirsutus TaxID=412623 RepID=UPI0036045BA0
MAEACGGDHGGGERGDLRDVRGRGQTTDHPERFKPALSHCSRGPLSPIRAAVRRTKANSQNDQTREQRRQEITIVSAEPLVSNNWFSGPPVVYLPPPHHHIGVPQCPPSYDQVIQEGRIVKPTAAPRRTACTATQTEPARENPSAAVPAEKRSAGRNPQKPPRPAKSEPAIGERATGGAACTDGDAQRSPTVSSKSEELRNSDINQPGPADSALACSKSVTVLWDIPTCRLSAAETGPSLSDLEPSERPVPLPRTKLPKQAKFAEIHEDIRSDPNDIPGEHLKELLEAFAADRECEDSSDIVNQSDEDGGEMNSRDSQGDMRARIQAFEVQTSSSEGNESRKSINKPPVAAKPSGAVQTLSYQKVDDSQNVSSANGPPTPAPKPPKKPMGLSVQQELETLHNKVSGPNRPRPSVLTRASCFCDDEEPPAPPAKPFKEPPKPDLNFNSHNAGSWVRDNIYVDSPANPVVVKPLQDVDGRPSLARRPTTIRVLNKAASFSDHFQDGPPPLPPQKPVGNPAPILPPQTGREPSLPPRRLNKSESLPPRPPPAKVGPGRPPPPSLQAIGRSQTVSWENSVNPEAPMPKRKGPVLPPRPNPGHRLYNKYTLQLPHAIAAIDHNGSNTGELSFQKNEVLLLLEELDHGAFECQVGDATGRVRPSHMTVITPLESSHQTPLPQDAGAPGPDGAEGGLQVQAVHDFTPEGPGELGLRAGNVVTMVQQVDREWYRGTCRGSTGFFPVNYVKVLSNSAKPLPDRKARAPSPTVSGPRCVARFDFEGEHSDELTFSEGDVIQLREYVGQDWARGQIGAFTGIFPLNFVEVVEDLPQPSSQQERKSIRIPLPGMVSSSTQSEDAKSSQTPRSDAEWVEALYDFAGNADGDLSFRRGDLILISKHIDAEWSSGRLDGVEGIFPTAFVKSSSGQPSSSSQQEAPAAEGRARALYNFASDCDEELSLQIGDIVTGLESLDKEWFLGDLRGRRALVPKNYVKVLD